MEEQQQKDDPESKKTVVQNSIKKLKKRFVPGVKYTLLLSAAINFAMLVVGCANVHKCPVNEKIPLFLIATGAIGLMSKFVSYIRDRISAHMQVVYLESALYGVETIFFFLGSYWVYKEFQPKYETSAGKLYCNKTAYIFAFTYLTVIYAFFLALLCGFCCFIICALWLVKKAADAVEESPASEATESLTTVTTKDVTESKSDS